MHKKIFISLVLLLLIGCSSTSNSNTLTVGMECNYAPFNWLSSTETEGSVFVEEAQGYCTGYDVRVAKELASELNKELVVKAISWDGLIPALQSNSIDLIIAGMTNTTERSEQISFTEPYYYSDYVMIVSKEGPYASATSLSDFKGANIVGQMGTNYDLIIDQIDGVNHLPALSSYPLIVNAINSQVADGAPAELPAAQSIIKTNPSLTIVEFPEGKGFTQNEDITTEVSIGVHKNNTELLNQVDDILTQINQQTRDTWMSEAISAND